MFLPSDFDGPESCEEDFDAWEISMKPELTVCGLVPWEVDGLFPRAARDPRELELDALGWDVDDLFPPPPRLFPLSYELYW